MFLSCASLVHCFEHCVFVSLCSSLFTECYFLYVFLHAVCGGILSNYHLWWPHHIMIILMVGLDIDTCQLFFEVPSVLNEAPENFYGSGVWGPFHCHLPSSWSIWVQGWSRACWLAPWILVGCKFLGRHIPISFQLDVAMRLGLDRKIYGE